MFGILVIQLQGLLIVACQHHFGTSAHAQHALMLVESLGGEKT